MHVRISARVLGEMSPDYLTDVIGLSPHDVSRKGEKRMPGREDSAIYRNNSWSYEGRPYDCSDVSLVLREFLGEFRHLDFSIAEINGVTWCCLDVLISRDVDVDRDGQIVGFEIANDVLRDMYRLGFSLQIAARNDLSS
ncbi:hypothetical protein FHW69_001518 [Luteibacter sp. Sphag1AF]|uniref:DUF4279 domain-containing protein n=1 Tax=Luteibacter sp. Sphag1AF TaxID=2587031 RepID=UPI00160B24B7|nr:DUF4279 domain-containing protein [Luteibacter sp. Sphag1AF]MBB3226917.1 hypothetical protein [Luteibacter sp. Sphag1AF]